MSKLSTQENINNRLPIKQDYAELIRLYNRLDNAQRVEFQHKLASLLEKSILPPQIEEYLLTLSQEHYERMFVYTQLLLLS